MPELTALLPRLREALAAALPAGGSAAVSASWTDSGADVLVVCESPPRREAHEALAAFAEAADLARLSWSRPGGAPEPVALRRPVRVVLGGIPVDVPAGTFLQPSAAGEAVLTAAVLDAVPRGGRIADLFCGCGTFALPLCGHGIVHAADSAADAVGALAAAAGRAGLAGRIATERRDLMRDPLSPSELARFQAVVFDPPRAGAQAQASALAQSKVPTVVAVSCDPASFARDARILVDGGYALGAVTPVDQFPWSPHVELVAVLRRP